MRRAELFDGFKIIEVGEGEEFRLERQFPGDVGSDLEFRVRADVSVKAKILAKDGKGTTCVVTKIVAKDSIAEQMLDSVDVEFESIKQEPVSEPIIFNSKDSKKNIVAQIEELGLDINTKQTKANILNELKELNNIEII